MHVSSGGCEHGGGGERPQRRERQLVRLNALLKCINHAI